MTNDTNTRKTRSDSFRQMHADAILELLQAQEPTGRFSPAAIVDCLNTTTFADDPAQRLNYKSWQRAFSLLAAAKVVRRGFDSSHWVQAIHVWCGHCGGAGHFVDSPELDVPTTTQCPTCNGKGRFRTR